MSPDLMCDATDGATRSWLVTRYPAPLSAPRTSCAVVLMCLLWPSTTRVSAAALSAVAGDDGGRAADGGGDDGAVEAVLEAATHSVLPVLYRHGPGRPLDRVAPYGSVVLGHGTVTSANSRATKSATARFVRFAATAAASVAASRPRGSAGSHGRLQEQAVTGRTRLQVGTAVDQARRASPKTRRPVLCTAAQTVVRIPRRSRRRARARSTAATRGEFGVPAPRMRRQERRVGLDQQLVQRHRPRPPRAARARS